MERRDTIEVAQVEVREPGEGTERGRKVGGRARGRNSEQPGGGRGVGVSRRSLKVFRPARWPNNGSTVVR